MAERSSFPELPVPSPVAGLATGDARAVFARITKQTPRNNLGEQAFLASKLQLVRTHPALHLAERAAVVAQFTARLKKQLPTNYTGPAPGGVGYGMFYHAPFKISFATGTAIYWQIICPTPPGGNVNTWLYLTATNRSAKGVEAFVSYNGQNQTFFQVYDWARSTPWQTNVPFVSLGDYLRTESAHGNPYQVLPLLNTTAQSGTNSWYNQVWLWHRVADRWDLIYQYDYSAMPAEQHTGWVGSWGPIVETFQNTYQGTHPLGALSTQLISRDGHDQWGSWHFLNPADSYVRTDNKGFQWLFLDPNFSWAVNS